MQREFLKKFPRDFFKNFFGEILKGVSGGVLEEMVGFDTLQIRFSSNSRISPAFFFSDFLFFFFNCFQNVPRWFSRDLFKNSTNYLGKNQEFLRQFLYGTLPTISGILFLWKISSGNLFRNSSGKLLKGSLCYFLKKS